MCGVNVGHWLYRILYFQNASDEKAVSKVALIELIPHVIVASMITAKIKNM